MGDGVTVVRVTAGRVAADRHPIGQIQLIRIAQPTSTYLIEAGFRFRHGIQRSGFRAAGIPGQDRKFFILQNTVVQLRDFPLYTFCDGSRSSCFRQPDSTANVITITRSTEIIRFISFMPFCFYLCFSGLLLRCRVSALIHLVQKPGRRIPAPVLPLSDRYGKGSPAAPRNWANHLRTSERWNLSLPNG